MLATAGVGDLVALTTKSGAAHESSPEGSVRQDLKDTPWGIPLQLPLGVSGRRALAEERRCDCHQNDRDEYLREQDEEPRALVPEVVADPQPHERADDSDDDRHDAPDRLHARNEDAGDEPDDRAGDQCADDA